jgi:hypothetical protein
MRTTEIIKEIKKLPIRKRKIVIEEVISSILRDEGRGELSQGADALVEEYKTNMELRAFHDIDLDDFNETR